MTLRLILTKFYAVPDSKLCLVCFLHFARETIVDTSIRVPVIDVAFATESSTSLLLSPMAEPEKKPSCSSSLTRICFSFLLFDCNGSQLFLKFAVLSSNLQYNGKLYLMFTLSSLFSFIKRYAYFEFVLKYHFWEGHVETENI